MSKHAFITATLFTLLISSPIVIAENASNFPDDLMYAGNPIDALCFANLENDTNNVRLNDCGISKQNYTPSGQNDTLVSKGFIGYTWKDESTSAQGYSYYKIFPAGNRLYWIYTINSGGGSGEFTAINLVKRKGDTLNVEIYADGDRCNGGIQDVSVDNRRITFSINLTAYDFLPLAESNPRHVKAYEDLPACATCCIAKAFYQANPYADLELQYVQLQKIRPNEMPDQGLYHACFNKIFATYVNKGETKLTYTQLRNFVDEFNQTCIK